MPSASSRSSPPTSGAPPAWLETGLDLPTHVKHLAVRVEGRALVYRAPNFNQSAISTRGWRVTSEPVASLVYRF